MRPQKIPDAPANAHPFGLALAQMMRQLLPPALERTVSLRYHLLAGPDKVRADVKAKAIVFGPALNAERLLQLNPLTGKFPWVQTERHGDGAQIKLDAAAQIGFEPGKGAHREAAFADGECLSELRGAP